MNRPPAMCGLRHVALNVEDVSECERFYVRLLGMKVAWRPDGESVYLCAGCDSLALHHAPDMPGAAPPQRLDHIGFALRSPELVDRWYEFLKAEKVPVRDPPRTHRDGARSFYCEDPGGNLVQMICLPPPASP